MPRSLLFCNSQAVVTGEDRHFEPGGLITLADDKTARFTRSDFVQDLSITIRSPRPPNAALMGLVRLFLAVLAISFVVIPAFGQSGTPHVMSREQTFRRSVLAGKDLRVFTYARWHQDCSPASPPNPWNADASSGPHHGD